MAHHSVEVASRTVDALAPKTPAIRQPRMPARRSFAASKIVKALNGALTAAAERVTDKNAGELSRLTLPWQQRALAHYDSTPEAWYASQFYARPLSKLRLFPAIMEENGEIREVDDDGDLLARVKDPSGGHAQLLENYGRLQFIIGDGYLTVSDPDGDEVWEFLSPNELRLTPDGRNFYRIRAPSMLPINLDLSTGDVDSLVSDEEVRVWRLYNKHPAFSLWPDSPMKAVLDLMDQLKALDRTANARIISRLAGSGILAVAEEITLPAPDAETADEDMENDVLMEDLIQHILAPIENPGSAAQLVPYILRISTMGRPIKELIEHFKLYDPNESFPEMERQKQLIERIAGGLDMPRETLEGKGSTNHWNGWMVNNDEWQAHQEPVAIRFVTDLTSSYYRPAALEMDLPDAERRLIWFDASKVVVYPDRGKDADASFDRGELSGEALRRSHGQPESDAPSDEERQRWLAVKLRDPVLAEAVAGEEKVAPSGAGVERTPPESPPPDEPITASANGNRTAMLLGVAEATVTRARALAGSKIRSRTMQRGDRGCQECAERIDRVEQSAVAWTLGAETIADLGFASMPALIDGTAEEFVTTARRFGLGSDAATALGEQIEKHAARTLLDEEPPPLPSSFSAYLERLCRDG